MVYLHVYNGNIETRIKREESSRIDFEIIAGVSEILAEFMAELFRCKVPPERADTLTKEMIQKIIEMSEVRAMEKICEEEGAGRLLN